MKAIKRVFLILLILILAGYGAYKILYPYVAPIVFDYLVDHNLEAFMKLEQSLEASLPEEEAPIPSASPTAQATPEPSVEPSPDASIKPSVQPTKKPNTDIQTVKTTLGTFTGEHLARALKNMSPADKTRIISLCQSAVSASDILKVSKMMTQDGLTADQQKYIENYLRDNLSVPAKKEILEILKTY